MRRINNPINAIATTYLPVASLFLLFFQAFVSCKKVDEHADLIEKLPYFTAEIGLGGLYNINQYDYPTKLLVGDTATIVGRLFLDQPATKIMLGNTPVTILAKARITSRQTNDRTGKIDSLDVGRFLVTKDMVGNNLPMTVYANGYTVHGAPVTVLLIDIGSRRTDTTLVVDKLGAWLPANPAVFQNQGIAPFVNNSSVAGDGTLYFDNLNGLFRLAGGQVSPVILTGTMLTDASQNSFTIKTIISSVISRDGNTLYFSSIDTEPVAPAADSLYITRLCSMNTQTQQVTTLNRTTVKKDLATYTENPGPFKGNIGTLKVVANFLSMDINGNLYFSNFYYPQNTGMNPNSGNQYNSTNDWYLALISASNILVNSSTSGMLGSICELDKTGQMTSLAQTENALGLIGATYYTTPGPLLNNNESNFLLSPDGTLIYGWQIVFKNIYYQNLVQYDQSQQDIENIFIVDGVNSNTYRFTSFDTAVSTQAMSSPKFRGPNSDEAGDFWNYLILPNNDLLYATITNYSVSSLYAYNLSTKTVYCYAGTENQNAQLQTNETGNAKFVNFQGPSLQFCGLDREGSVYYCIGGMVNATSTANNDYVNGVRFYKLHRKTS